MLAAQRDQAYAGYLAAKAAESQLKSTDLAAAQAQADAGVDQAYAAWKGAQAQLAKLRDRSTQVAARQPPRLGSTQASDALELAEDRPR